MDGDCSYALSLRLHKGWLEQNDEFQLNLGKDCNLGLVMIRTFETERAINTCL
jgi:hypothetical protein